MQSIDQRSQEGGREGGREGTRIFIYSIGWVVVVAAAVVVVEHVSDVATFKRTHW